MRNIFVFCLLFSCLQTFAQQTPYENSGKKETTTYKAAIEYYQLLAKNYPQAKLLTYGTTDFGLPLHLVVLSRDKIF